MAPFISGLVFSTAKSSFLAKEAPRLRECDELVPAALVPVPVSPVSMKLYTYDGKTNWEVYKIQFGIISEANRWTEEVKACQLVASLRGEAAEVLQTLTDTEMLKFGRLLPTQGC
ncbi:uncharacterized protein TNCV_495371 [Trichonephila clavipes]|nr:uncharacterized protein TNCV_495371 [Trichonephila clavipes]